MAAPAVDLMIQVVLGWGLAFSMALGSDSMALGSGGAPTPCEQVLSEDGLNPENQSRLAVSEAVKALQKPNLAQNEFNLAVATLAVQLTELELLDLIREAKSKLEALDSKLTEARACGNQKVCWLTKIQQFQIKLTLFIQSINRSLGGEKLARSRLREVLTTTTTEARGTSGLSEEDAQASESMAQPELFSLTKLERFSRGEKLGLMSAFHKLLDSVRALSFRELRHSPVARASLRKDLAITLGYQAFAQILLLVSQNSADNPLTQATHALLTNPNWPQAVETLHQLSISSQWSLFPLTILMMSLQENQAAKHQTISIGDDERYIVKLENLITRLPRIIQGREGYWSEAKVKLHSFLALLPFEWAAVNVFSSLRTATNYGLAEAANWQSLADAAMVNGLSLAIFGTYLAVKWAFLEKMINLGLLPVVRKGYLQVAQDALDQLMKGKDKDSEGDVMPDSLTLRQFAKAYDLHGDVTRDPALQGWLGRVRRWRAKLPIGAPIPEAEWVRILGTDEARDVMMKYRQNQKAFLTEWLWRAGNRTFDAIFVFGLFGHIVPEILGLSDRGR